jgi:hypothetical protein
VTIGRPVLSLQSQHTRELPVFGQEWRLSSSGRLNPGDGPARLRLDTVGVDFFSVDDLTSGLP